ncbi:MAG: metal-dependent transcriptional regulator [Ruminococcaceae bacterium]|nr:metal-dependent transcriptional regulator [Oscillospiraceae bacterium]
MSLKESGEMYLESIYVLCKSKNSVRSVDVAEHMNYSRASVSRGVGLLRKQGYLEMDADGFITLTAEGAEMAEKIFERHTVITNILIAMGIDAQTAAEDACRIEHVISEETFNGLKAHYEKYK